MSQIDSRYFKEYRERLGFTNQATVKAFFAAKDIYPEVDFNYISQLNHRLVEIVHRLDQLVAPSLKLNDIANFCQINIFNVFERLSSNRIITRLNNQGRRPEEVYFSWMRGFVITNYFSRAIAHIFEVSLDNISFIGDDDLVNIETFKRTPTADLQIRLRDNSLVRVEVQSGFQGINDIKQHKILEAKRVKFENNISSIVIHFDIFNGQVAFVQADQIEDGSINWITRAQMEGQTVFNIDQNYFVWKLTENPPLLSSLEFI